MTKKYFNIGNTADHFEIGCCVSIAEEDGSSCLLGGFIHSVEKDIVKIQKLDGEIIEANKSDFNQMETRTYKGHELIAINGVKIKK